MTNKLNKSEPDPAISSYSDCFVEHNPHNSLELSVAALLTAGWLHAREHVQPCLDLRRNTFLEDAPYHNARLRVKTAHNTCTKFYSLENLAFLIIG